MSEGAEPSSGRGIAGWIWPWGFVVLTPIALWLERSHGIDKSWAFVASCAAIIPLAAILGQATEQVSDRAGAALGGILNATFGNAAELIIALVALSKGKTAIVMASLTGSVIGNVLFVFGLAALAGGLKWKRQTFNLTAAHSSAASLHLAVFALVIPAVMHEIPSGLAARELMDRRLSLGIAAILMATYAASLLFSLKTHRHLFDEEEIPDDLAPGVVTAAAATATRIETGRHWNMWVAVGVLVGASALVALVSEALVSSVESAIHRFGFGEAFVGVIVFAIIGNAAEHTTAVIMALRGRMGLAIGISLESSKQIAIFVTPLLVFAGLFVVPRGAKPMTLHFELPEVVAMWASVQIVDVVIADGETNWLEGVQLLAVYAIIAVSFYVLSSPG